MIHDLPKDLRLKNLRLNKSVNPNKSAVAGAPTADLCPPAAGAISDIGASPIIVADFGICDIGVPSMIASDSDLLLIFDF